MIRHMTLLVVVALLVVAGRPFAAHADDEFRWRVDDVCTLGGKPIQETTYFETEREALAHKQMYEKVQNLKKGGPAYTNWKITKERKPTTQSKDKTKEAQEGAGRGGDVLWRLRDAKKAVGLALKASKEELAKKELLLRETIDEYKQSVADTFRRIKELEKNLRGGTQEMQEKSFQEINAVVDRYNRQISDFQGVMGPVGTLGYSPLPRFQPPVPEKAGSTAAVAPSSGVSGKTWNIDYYGLPLVVTFQEGGRAVGNYNKEVVGRQGKWSQEGDLIVITLPSAGRPGYSSYSEGFAIRGKVGADGQLQLINIDKNVP
jgi:hypothetical protein